MVAFLPPMAALTGSNGMGSGMAANTPFWPGGLVCPAPVMNSVTIWFELAGLDELFTEPFWLSAAACPVPEPFKVKTAVADGTTLTAAGAVLWPWFTMKTCAVEPVSENGAMADTWLGIV